jgi:hypothetical protein
MRARSAKNIELPSTISACDRFLIIAGEGNCRNRQETRTSNTCNCTFIKRAARLLPPSAKVRSWERLVSRAPPRATFRNGLFEQLQLLAD